MQRAEDAFSLVVAIVLLCCLPLLPVEFAAQPGTAGAVAAELA